MKRKLEKIILVILMIQVMILGNFVFVLNSIVKAVGEEEQNSSAEQIEQEDTSKQKEENVWLEQKVLTNKIFNYEGKDYRVLQLQLETKFQEYPSPVKTSEIELQAPKLKDGKNPFTVIVETPETLATNGKFITEEEYQYDSSKGITKMTINNPEQEGKVVWNKTGEDKYVVTYLFDSVDIVEETSVNAKLNLYLYDENNTQITKTNEIQVTAQEIDGVVETNIINLENEIYKGKLYQGIEREISENIELQVNLLDKIDKIVVQEDFSQMNLSNINTKSIEVESETLKNVLGEQGIITIIDKFTGQQLGQINKENTTFQLPENISEIVMETSKPEKTGVIKLKTTKGIGQNEKETVQSIQDMRYCLSTFYMEGDIQSNLAETSSLIKLLETQTSASLQINKTEYSAMITNENVEIKVVLNSNDEKYELYKNAFIKITLPEEFEKIEVTSIKLLDEEELYIKPGTARLQGNVISMELAGEQTAYKEPSINGATIVITANLTTSKKQKNVDSQITLEYTNENAVHYANNQNNGIETKDIKITSYADVITTNQIAEYNLEVINNEGENIAPLPIKSQQKQLTVSSEIINNEQTTIKNVKVLGTYPTENAISENTIKSSVNSIQVEGIDSARIKVYYTENENANTDLTDDNNAWQEVLDNGENAKKYMVVTDQLTQEETLNFSYQVQVPENLDYNQTLNEGYEVYYTDENAVEENVQVKNLRLETGKGPVVDVKLNAKMGGQDVTTVHEGETVSYEITAENTGTEAVTDLQLIGSVPEGTVFVTERQIVPGENSDSIQEGLVEDANRKEVNYENIELQPGEKVTKTYLVRVKTGIADTVNKISNTIQAKYGDVIKSSETVENSIEKGEISLEILPVDCFNDKLEVGSYYRYGVLVKNITNVDLENIKLNLECKNVRIESIMYTDADGAVAELPGVTEYTIPSITAGGIEKIYFSIYVEPFTDAPTREVVIATTATVNDTKYFSNERKINLTNVFADLSISSETEGQYIKSGEEVVYQIKVTNSGIQELPFITIEDIISEYLEVENVEVDGTLLQEGEYELLQDLESTNSLLRIENSLGAGQTKTYTIRAHVSEDLPVFTEVQEVVNKAVMYAYSMEIANAQIIHLLDITPEENPDDNPDDNPGEDPDDNPEENPGDEVIHQLVSGIAWLDQNEDGKKDNNETLLQGITVKAFNIETNQYQTDKDGNQVQANTNENGIYTLSLPQGKYILIFEYDKERYILTTFEQTGVSADANSKVINKNITIDGTEVNVDTTEVITIENDNISYINIGLKNRKKYDMKLEKTISRVIVQNSKGTQVVEYENANFAKVEMDAKLLNGTNVIVEYHIKVTNEGEVPGYIRKIVDYMSPEYKFSSELNKDWYQIDSNLYNSSLSNEKINPGESKEVTLTLTKQMTENNTGTVNNLAEIAESYNEQGFKDMDSTEGNKVQGEDDMGSADVVLSIKTGQVVTILFIVFITIAIIGTVAYIVIKRVNKRVE